MLKQSIVQKQKLKVSQQNIQLFKLIELNALQLEEKIKEELDENPALEIQKNDTEEQFDESRNNDTDDIDYDLDYASDDHSEENDYNSDIYEEFKVHHNNVNEYDYSYDDDEKDYFVPAIETPSFITNLIHQFKYLHSDPKTIEIGEYIIGNLDQDGFLRRDIELLVDELSFKNAIYSSVKEVEKILKDVQKLEPAGIGARDIQECLLLQIKRKSSSIQKTYALEIFNKYFQKFIKKEFSWLKNKLKANDTDFEETIKFIQSLNPKPIEDINESSIGKYVYPDFIVYRNSDKLKLELYKNNMPNLEISKEFLDLLKKFQDERKENQTAFQFVKDKLYHANNFIQNLKQREETMILLMQAIVDFQRPFFLTGNEALLNPMGLKHVSEKTDFDVSTISRFSNSKYVQTDFGIYSLKFFFSEGIENIIGEEVSTRSVKIALKEIINHEDKFNPFTDEELVLKLKLKGFRIARRTVAKYRDIMDIAPRHLRRSH